MLESTASQVTTPEPTTVSDIAQRVMRRVGIPEGFVKTDVRHLYLNRYRVNIWASTPASGNRIAHSEFVRDEIPTPAA